MLRSNEESRLGLYKLCRARHIICSEGIRALSVETRDVPENRGGGWWVVIDLERIVRHKIEIEFIVKR